MSPEIVEKLRLIPDKTVDPLTQKPIRYRIEGLPGHLEAEIRGTDQSLYKYFLTRAGDRKYEPSQGNRTPQDALEALKRLLTWGPVR